MRMEGKGFEKREDMKCHVGGWKVKLLKKYNRIAMH